MISSTMGGSCYVNFSEGLFVPLVQVWLFWHQVEHMVIYEIN